MKKILIPIAVVVLSISGCKKYSCSCQVEFKDGHIDNSTHKVTGESHSAAAEPCNTIAASYLQDTSVAHVSCAVPY
jgi:hypothetical protein